MLNDTLEKLRLSAQRVKAATAQPVMVEEAPVTYDYPEDYMDELYASSDRLWAILEEAEEAKELLAWARQEDDVREDDAWAEDLFEPEDRSSLDDLKRSALRLRNLL